MSSPQKGIIMGQWEWQSGTASSPKEKCNSQTDYLTSVSLKEKGKKNPTHTHTFNSELKWEAIQSLNMITYHN